MQLINTFSMAVIITNGILTISACDSEIASDECV